MEKPELLLLCHRIPFPPDKGDKIRSFQLLRYLCQHYRVYLGCFIDDPEDAQHVAFLNGMCESCFCIEINPRLSRIKSLIGLLSGQAMTVPFYNNIHMSKWVEKLVSEQSIKRCVVFSSSMAQYLIGKDLKNISFVVDFVDVDSDKWRQYADKKPWPANWLFRREADKLLEFERYIASIADNSLLVSSVEADLFRQLVPGLGKKIDFYNNGVDADYFDPTIEFDNPYLHERGNKVLVFTGAMDYWPNVDAVKWFASSIFPRLLQKTPSLRFYIVGRNPTRDVIKLESRHGVVVTGRVDDIRPYLKFADAVVAPMRIARGVQNKILEAMAMEKVVMSSDQALEGIDAELGSEILLSNSVDDYAEYLPKILDRQCGHIGTQARLRVLRDFNWDQSLPLLGRLLEGDKEFAHDQ
jgi:sugar transferase (PEP-CTERM/EpsH1 system associated)